MGFSVWVIAQRGIQKFVGSNFFKGFKFIFQNFSNFQEESLIAQYCAIDL